MLGEDGSPAGQVTSSRHSPVLDRTIGMAWVPAALAHDGAKITISDVGRELDGRDPDPTVLRPRRGGAAVMSALDFLSAGRDGDVLARSPMEALAVDAGARLEARDGWNVAVSYPAASFGESVSWCDTSHLPKLQLQGSLDPSLPFGTAVRRDGAWWCRLTESARARGRSATGGARRSLKWWT